MWWMDKNILKRFVVHFNILKPIARLYAGRFPCELDKVGPDPTFLLCVFADWHAHCTHCICVFCQSLYLVCICRMGQCVSVFPCICVSVYLCWYFVSVYLQIGLCTVQTSKQARKAPKLTGKLLLGRDCALSTQFCTQKKTIRRLISWAAKAGKIGIREDSAVALREICATFVSRKFEQNHPVEIWKMTLLGKLYITAGIGVQSYKTF